MIVMPANNSGLVVGYLAGKYPGRIGWMMSPNDWKSPHEVIPYHLDNGAFPSFTKGTPWDEAAFYEMLSKTRGMTLKPRWIAVPDV